MLCSAAAFHRFFSASVTPKMSAGLFARCRCAAVMELMPVRLIFRYSWKDSSVGFRKASVVRSA